MARPSIPAHVIAQRGKKITLIDETDVSIVFTFSSIMRIEEDFGSVAGALAAVSQGEKGAAFTALAQIIAAGLEHATVGDGAHLSDVENLRAVLDPMRFEDYSDALGGAMEAAFPQDDKAGEGDADPQTDSPGESGTTSPSSLSDEVSASSGT